MGVSARIDWKNLRKDYEEQGLNATALGIKYNCSSQTVYQRAKSEQWIRPLEEENPTIDEEFIYDEDEDLQLDLTLIAQKRHLGKLMRELDASAAKPGQLKQWIKEGIAGNMESRRKALYQVLSIPNRFIMLKNASSALKTLVEAENMMTVPKGKKAKQEKEADELEDDRFSSREPPSVAA